MYAPISSNCVQGPQGLGFETPLYNDLETNIPHFLMAYSDKAFPHDASLFPKHGQVLQYLEEYAREIEHLVSFGTQVKDVRPCGEDDPCRDRWRVTTKDLQSQENTSSVYDAVVVANGHYTVHHIPDVPGLSEWNNAYPGTIIHSKAYRHADSYSNKNVLVIGNSASGIDIAAQIGQFCSHPLLLSSRSESPFQQGGAAWREDVPEVLQFLPSNKQNRAVRFANGRIEKNIDAVIFATGYFFSFPFLSELAAPVITDGFRTNDVYQHFLYIDHPTLAFPVLNLKIIPFPLAENQCSIIARLWSGRLAMPSKAEMRQWEKETIQERGPGKGFHVLKFPLDAEYLNTLFHWAESAEKVQGLDNDGTGKLGKYWDGRDIWMRSRFPAIKKAYAERREERFKVRTAEELGFVYLPE